MTEKCLKTLSEYRDSRATVQMSRVNGTVPEVGAGNWKSPFGRAFVGRQLTDCSTDVIGRDSTRAGKWLRKKPRFLRVF